jgi:hypothetical protein
MGSGRNRGRGPPIVRQVDLAVDIVQVVGPQLKDSNRDPLHPTLLRLSATLGREAAAFARRYRYAGLGRIELILRSRGEL